MKTEINGDWKGYLKRFKLPSREVMLLPLGKMGICVAIQIVACVLAVYTHALMLVVSSLVIGAFLYAAYKQFWELVLEEAKGFWADILMWLYYFALVAVAIVLPLVIVWPYLN